MKYILYTFVVCILFVGCRKKIEHDLGYQPIVEETEEIVSQSNTNGTWRLISDTLGEVQSLAEYQNALYIGSYNESEVLLMKYDQTSLSNAVDFDIDGQGIFDMGVFDDKLWIGGGFYYYANNKFSRNLMIIDKQDVIGFEFGEYGDKVNCITQYQSNVAVLGDFIPSGDCKSFYAELFAGTTAIGFEQTYTRPVIDAIEYDNCLFLVNDKDSYFNSASHSISVYYNQIWYNYSDLNSYNDRVFSLELFENELYISGYDNYNERNLFIYENDYYNNLLSEIKVKGTAPHKLYAKDDQLYIYGQGIGIGDKYVSSVVSLQNGNYYAIGSLKATVNDLIVYEGHLYAATSNGLYVFESNTWQP